MPILTVTGGTAGVGTTTVATNLAVVLARLGRRVIILDLAPAPGAVASRLGASVNQAWRHGRHPTLGVVPALAEGPHGLRIMASHAGGRRWFSARTQTADVVDTIGLLAAVADFVVVDVPTGLSTLNDVAVVSERVLTVTGTSASSIAGSCGLVRQLCGLGIETEIGIVVNGVSNVNEAGWAYRAVCESAESTPVRRPESYGFVTTDPQVPRAQMMRRAVVDCRPHSPSSRCFDALGLLIAHGGPFDEGGLSVLPLTWEASCLQAAGKARQCA